MGEEKGEGREKLVERYSKKWGISPEEAEKRIQATLEKKGTPTLENIFPSPLGPVSQKTQDINQALLSSQITRKFLSGSDENIGFLNQKLMEVNQSLNSWKDVMGGKIDQITATLDVQKQKEAQDGLKKQLEDAMSPIKQKLEAMEAKVSKEGGNIPPQTATDLGTLLNAVQTYTEGSKKFLASQGYRVEAESITKDEVSKMISDAQKSALDKAPPDELMRKVEGMGYKVVGGPITFDQAKNLAEEAFRKGQESALDDKRVQSVTDLINNSVKSILDMFKPGMQAWIEGQLKGSEQPSSQQQTPQQGLSPSEQGSPSAS